MAGGCGGAARSLLRLCAALLLALGLAMCVASAVLYAQWRAQASAGASGAPGDASNSQGAPWFLYCTFGAGGAPLRSRWRRMMRSVLLRRAGAHAGVPCGTAYVSVTALFGLLGASPHRPRCLNTHVGLLVAGMVPQARRGCAVTPRCTHASK